MVKKDNVLMIIDLKFVKHNIDIFCVMEKYCLIIMC